MRFGKHTIPGGIEGNKYIEECGRDSATRGIGLDAVCAIRLGRGPPPTPARSLAGIGARAGAHACSVCELGSQIAAKVMLTSPSLNCLRSRAACRARSASESIPTNPP